MQKLLDRAIGIQRTIILGTDHAWALGDPTRARILDALYGKSLSAAQITQIVNKNEKDKALTTIRHHLRMLKKSGLIEVVRTEERRGTVVKYYGTRTKLLEYNAPEDFDKEYSSVIEDAVHVLEPVLKKIVPKPIKSDNASQPIVMEVLNRAVTTLFDRRKGVGKRLSGSSNVQRRKGRQRR